MKRMFVSSFYNTLINKEEAIPISTMLSIDKMRKKGTKLTILTNRLYEDVIYYNKDYPFIDYIISLNGSIIHNVEKNKVIYKQPINKEKIKQIVNEFKNEKIIFYTPDNFYYELPTTDIYKIEIKNTKKNRNKLNNLNIEFTEFKINREKYIEINDTTPYNSLLKLIDNLDINKSELIGVVGNMSEIDILKIKDMYIVSSSPKKLKQSTKNKTKSNDSKGVELVINKYLK